MSNTNRKPTKFVGLHAHDGFSTFDGLDYPQDHIDFVRESIQGHDTIIALGGFVSSVLKRMNIDHITTPHPSPLNRNLNDKDYERAMLEDMRNKLP